MILGIIAYGATSDRYLQYRSSQSAAPQPESRLLYMVIGSIILPIGLFLYGWSLAYHFHWIIPVIGTAFVGNSVILTILPTENYLVDVFEAYGASAVAIGVVSRAVIGALLPLAGPLLYNSRLGLGWGNTLLGFLILAFVPVLVASFKYGNRLRGNDRHWSGR